MSEIRFDHKEYVHFLWLMPLLATVFMYGFWRKRRSLQVFATGNLLDGLVPQVSVRRQHFKAAFVLLTMAFVALGLTGPRWGMHFEEVHRKGVDVVIALDVSRSMLAEDIAPNRIERAKLVIGDLLEQLEGDRIGLVTFAGAAVKKCPLTLNYGSFKMALSDVDTYSSPRGGTLVGDAIRKAKECFVDRVKDHKAIILISDGEEHESDYPVEAAQAAYAEHGIVVCTVGIGDVREGGRIPVVENGQRTFLKHDGQEVWSKMHPAVLQEMAVVGGGMYLPAETRDFDLGTVYEWIRGKLNVVEYETEFTERYYAQFQWFAGVALLLLIAETLMTDRKKFRVPGSEFRVPWSES
ncbi:MAG: VWA domain-containing protein [bacterium]|nr:VWA domain-containing protein [bacterium]